MNAWVLLSGSTAQQRLSRRPYDPQSRPKEPRRRHASRNCASEKRERKRRARALQVDVRAAMSQIGTLQRQLALASSRAVTTRVNSEAAAIEIVATYHRLMGHGYDSLRDSEATAFLQSSMDERFVHPDYVGRDMFMKQWELYSQYHISITVEPQSLSIVTASSPLLFLGGSMSPATAAAEEAAANAIAGSGDEQAVLEPRDPNHQVAFVVRSRGVTTLRISRGTFEHVFPHILPDEALVQSLIGKEYTFAYTFFAYINTAGRIFQLESTIDLASALLELLSDPFATVKMVEASTITKGGNLTMPDVVQESQNEIKNGFL